MNATWEVCSSSWVNVTLHLESRGYPPHGHDVLVTACLSGARSGVVLYDLEELKAKLKSILDEVNYSDLAKLTGSREASLEDLVLYVCEKLRERIDDSLKVSYVEAAVPSGLVRIRC